MNRQDSPLPSADDCRAALLTPPGRGAVATILVHGKEATHVVQTCFQSASGKRLADLTGDRIAFGRLSATTVPGEDLVIRRVHGDQIEIHCHGGSAAVENIFQILTAAGCQRKTWQDIDASKQGDALAAEARQALAAARTQRTAAILLDQYRGALRSEITEIETLLQTEQLNEAQQRLARLLEYGRIGLHLTQSWRIVLAGSPNVGKSSLVNAILGYQRSIVMNHPGTTRDVLTEQTALDGWPVELSDTAGLRAVTEQIESAGVALALKQVQQADALLLVFDASVAWTEENAALLANYPQALLIHNKADLASNASDRRPEGILTSAITGKGISELIAKIVRQLVPVSPPAGAAVPFNQRQNEGLCSVLEATKHGDTTNAAALLREVYHPTATC